MANVGVTFDFAAESAKLRSEIDKVRKEVSALNKTAKSVESGFKAMGAAILGAISVRAVVSFGQNIARAADQINDLSTRLGASASGLQTLQVAAQQAGGSAGGMEQALAKLQVTIGEGLQGNKQAAEAFQQLGLSARELAGLKTDEAMRRVAVSLSEVGNEYQRAQIGQDIFGKGFKENAGFFADAAESIDAVSRALADAGATIDDLDIAKIGVMNDELALQGQIVQNLAIGFVADLSPAVMVASESMQSIVQSISGATKSGEIFGTVMVAAIKSIEAGVQGLISWFEFWRGVGAKLFEGITFGASKALGAMASLGDALGLDIAPALQRAAEAAGGWSAQFKIGADAAFASAARAKDAAIKAGLDVLRADEIFAASAARLQAAAEAASARAQAPQGAFDAAVAAGAAGKDQSTVRDPSLLSRDNLGRLDPFRDPLILEQISINDTLQAVTDAHNATMLGKIEAFEQSKIGMLLNSAELQQQIEWNKNATLGDAMSTLVGVAIQQGGALGKAGKAVAIAQTVWSTGQAIMKAMAEVPWPANIAAAASVASMGVAQLANIKRTNIGSSGSIVAGRGGSIGATAPSLSDNVQGATGTPLQQQSAVQIIVQGSLFAAQETVDWLTEQIGAAVMDRDVVFISGNSRQAMELRG